MGRPIWGRIDLWRAVPLVLIAVGLLWLMGARGWPLLPLAMGAYALAEMLDSAATLVSRLTDYYTGQVLRKR